MNREFEQLLEDQWEGRLTAAGRQRLNALAAADPALAQRLAEEEKLSGMLAACGPNLAPRDLAAGVFSRLAEPELEAAGKDEAAAQESRRSLWSFFQIPALRWGMGFAVALFVMVEIGVLIQMNREPIETPLTGAQIALTDAREVQIVSTPPNTRENLAPPPDIRQAETAAAPAPERDVQITMALPESERVNPEPPAARPTARESADKKAAVPVPTATPAPPQMAADSAIAAAKPVPTPGPTPAPSRDEVLMAAAEPVKTPEPTPAPSTAAVEIPQAAEPVPNPSPAPKPEIREIRVALQVVLPDPARPDMPVGTARGGFPGGNAFRVQGGNVRIPAGTDGSRTLRNGLAPAVAALDTPTGSAEGAAPMATRKDIEIALAGVGARFEAEPANDMATLWQIRTTLTEHQLGDFMHALRQQNLIVAEPPEVQPTPSPAADAKSGSLGRFQTLESTGVAVERKGAAVANQGATVTLREDVPPGQFAVLEGEPLMRELTAAEESGPVKLSNLNARPRMVQLTLLIQEPVR